jgi:imidazolonepropionase-like amidohydrolase
MLRMNNCVFYNMKLIKADYLFDGINERKDVFIGFDEDMIKYVDSGKPEEGGEIVIEGHNIVVTPAFIDSHSHIGLQRSTEYSGQYEENEQMDSTNPMVNALHSLYMDDPAFSESVEHGVLYSAALPGSANVIGGKVVLIRNYAKDVEEAFICDIGIKAALGFHPRSMTGWTGKRPSTRMGVVSILRENFIKAKKMQNLLNAEKKTIDEVDPNTEVYMDMLAQKHKIMTHLHKEDDVRILIQLVKEFNLKVVANHCLDVHREEIFAALKANSIPIIYGPMDSFSNKDELRHNNWRNAELLLKSGAKFSLMSDHPITLQRTMFFTLRHLLRFGLPRPSAISKITSEAAEILGIPNLGQIRPGFKASFIIWNGDPFSISSYPILVIGEGKVVFKD